MNNDKIINQFFGFRCSPTGVLSAGSQAANTGRSVSGQLVTDPPAGRIIGMLMGNRLTNRLVQKISAFEGEATLSRIAFKIYDNWKHAHNEFTEIAAEVDFRDYGLKLSGIEPLDFELSMMKVVLGSADVGGRLDVVMQQTLSARVKSMPADCADIGLIKQLQASDSLIVKPDAGRLCLELKIELYLAAYLVAGVNGSSATPFLKRLAKELQLPDGIISQIQFQLPQSLPQAA